MSDGWDWNSRLTRRSVLRGAGVAVAGLAGAALIGCEDDDDDDATPAPAAATPAATTAAATPAPTATTAAAAPAATPTATPIVPVRRTATPTATEAPAAAPAGPTPGGTMVASDAYTFEAYGAAQGGPFSLFAGQTTSAEHSGVWDFLMARRHSLDPEPRIAESWEQNGDATSTEVKLYPDLTFHNGKPLDAAAVKRSYESMSEEGTAPNQTGTLANRYLDSIDVVNSRTLRFNHPNWPGPIIFDLFTLAPIHDADNLADYYAMTEVNGSGPFKFDLDSWKPGEGWTAVPHDNYPLPVYLDAIEHRVVADADVRALALESGEIDLAHIEPAQFHRMQGMDHLRVETGAASAMFVIGPVRTLLGGGHPANDDPRFLRAVSRGLDRESIRDEVFEGIVSVRSQFFLESSPAYDAANNVPYDPEGARALLEEAGLVDTEITLFVLPGEFPDSFPEAIQADMREIGINVTIEIVDGGTFWGGFLSGTFEGWYTTGFGFHWMNPETFLNTNYQVRTTNGVNAVAEVSQDYLDLVAAFAEQPTPGERAALLDQFNKRFAERPHVIPVVASEDTWAINNRVNGEPATVRNQYFMNELWISDA